MALVTKLENLNILKGVKQTQSMQCGFDRYLSSTINADVGFDELSVRNSNPDLILSSEIKCLLSTEMICIQVYSKIP